MERTLGRLAFGQTEGWGFLFFFYFFKVKERFAKTIVIKFSHKKNQEVTIFKGR